MVQKSNLKICSLNTVWHDGEERRNDDSADAERAIPEADPHQVDVERGRQQEEVTYTSVQTVR